MHNEQTSPEHVSMSDVEKENLITLLYDSRKKHQKEMIQLLHEKFYDKSNTTDNKGSYIFLTADLLDALEEVTQKTAELILKGKFPVLLQGKTALNEMDMFRYLMTSAKNFLLDRLRKGITHKKLDLKSLEDAESGELYEKNPDKRTPFTDFTYDDQNSPNPNPEEILIEKERQKALEELQQNKMPAKFVGRAVEVATADKQTPNALLVLDRDKWFMEQSLLERQYKEVLADTLISHPEYLQKYIEEIGVSRLDLRDFILHYHIVNRKIEPFGKWTEEDLKPYHYIIKKMGDVFAQSVSRSKRRLKDKQSENKMVKIFQKAGTIR